MDYIPPMTNTTQSPEPYRICCLCNEDVPADRVLHTGVGTICADQYACEVRQGQRLADAPFVCVNCGHEHQAVDLDEIVIIDAEGFGALVLCADQIKDGTAVLCADEDACERRMAQQPQPDFGPDPEDAAPSHLDGDPDEGHMYPDDGDGYYDTDGWD